MITKAIVRSINGAANRCKVRMPLFETASSNAPVEAEALVCIPSGIYNNLEVGDIVFVAFEENAIEKPIIIGKLFKGTRIESSSNQNKGMGIFYELLAREKATVPHTTNFKYPEEIEDRYVYLDTPYEVAEYILWLEDYTKRSLTQLDKHFRCFKNWTQWQFKPQNVEIDDGDLDNVSAINPPYKYQEEGQSCQVCSTCTRGKVRTYTPLNTTETYETNLAGLIKEKN